MSKDKENYIQDSLIRTHPELRFFSADFEKSLLKACLYIRGNEIKDSYGLKSLHCIQTAYFGIKLVMVYRIFLRSKRRTKDYLIIL